MGSGLTPPHELDEEELILRAIKGDGQAFGSLYERHLDAIYRYVFFKIGDAAEAEDLTEDVFVRAWEALPGYQVRQHPFTSWLYRIAHNLTIDHMRRRKPMPLIESDEYPDPVGPASPEDALERAQTLQALQGALHQLSAEEQLVIVLRFVEGLSHEEVAATLGKSNEASRVIQHRALARLNGLLKR
jgi:RNA polymerase sigma-70 factor (ECF subfamily)